MFRPMFHPAIHQDDSKRKLKKSSSAIAIKQPLLRKMKNYKKKYIYLFVKKVHTIFKKSSVQPK